MPSPIPPSHPLSLTRPSSNSPAVSSTNPLTHLIIHQFNHSLTHSLIHHHLLIHQSTKLSYFCVFHLSTPCTLTYLLTHLLRAPTTRFLLFHTSTYPYINYSPTYPLTLTTSHSLTNLQMIKHVLYKVPGNNQR